MMSLVRFVFSARSIIGILAFVTIAFKIILSVSSSSYIFEGIPYVNSFGLVLVRYSLW